jgi:hypothetical protein
MTYLDMARKIASSAGVITYSDDELDSVLWEHTAFPFCDVPYLQGQLEEFFAQQKGLDQ